MVRPSMVLVALVVVCAACNALVGYDNLEKTPSGPGGTSSGGGKGDDDDDDDNVDASAGSGSSSGGTTPDSGSSGGRCDPSKPFGTPVLVDALDGWNAQLSTDELEAFWIGPQNTLHTSKRAKRDAAWEGVGTVLMSPKFLLLQSIAQNGQKMYYIPDNGDLVMRASTRPDRNSDWAPAVKVQEPGSADNLYFADSDDIVYLDAFKSGTSGERNLFTAALTGGTISTTFTSLPITDQAGVTEWHPVVNSSQTNLYFLRGQEPNAKVFHSRRATKGSTWETPVEEPTLNGGDGDAPAWVAEDDCVIYLSREFKTFTATRPQ